MCFFRCLLSRIYSLSLNFSHLNMMCLVIVGFWHLSCMVFCEFIVSLWLISGINLGRFLFIITLNIFYISFSLSFSSSSSHTCKLHLYKCLTVFGYFVILSPVFFFPLLFSFRRLYCISSRLLILSSPVWSTVNPLKALFIYVSVCFTSSMFFKFSIIFSIPMLTLHILFCHRILSMLI